MTREVIKELLPIFHAFAEGKTIQCCDRNKPNYWWDIQCKDPSFDLDLFEYRVKSEEKELIEKERSLDKSSFHKR